MHRGLSGTFGMENAAGWSDLLCDVSVDPVEMEDGYWLLPAGRQGAVGDGSVSLSDIRSTQTELATSWDVVVVHFGSLADAIDAELILNATDFCLAHVARGDRLAPICARAPLVDRLPRNGGGLWLDTLRKSDTALAG